MHGSDPDYAMGAPCSTAQDRLLEFDGDRFAHYGGKGKLIPAAGARAEISRRSAYFYQRTNAWTDLSDDTKSAGSFVIFGSVSPSSLYCVQKALEVPAVSLEKRKIILGALVTQGQQHLVAGGAIDVLLHEGH